MVKDKNIVSVNVSDWNLTASYSGKIKFDLDVCLRTILDFILELRKGWK